MVGHAARLQAQAEALAEQYFRALPPGLTVEDALLMAHSGERNLVLRKALGIDFPGRVGEVVMVNQGDIIQVVQRNLTAARRVEQLLKRALPGWSIGTTKRPDRAWLVTGYLDVDGSNAASLEDARRILAEMLDR